MSKIRKWLFSSFIVRNIIADFGGRARSFRKNNKFTPYFQYEIGKYQPDFKLYFIKSPNAVQYYNEIFNKMLEYTGYDIIKYLDFHFSSYNDKIDFLRFIRYEVDERNIRASNVSLKLSLITALQWISEKFEEIQGGDWSNVNDRIADSVREVLKSQPEFFTINEEAFIEKLTFPITEHLKFITEESEERFQSMARTFTTGNIQLNNLQHTEKLLQAFYLFSTVKAPGSKTDGLFKEFTVTDLAFLLNMHFSEFKGMKPNTVQKKIAVAVEKVRFENPQVKKLNEALQEFFYS